MNFSLRCAGASHSRASLSATMNEYERNREARIARNKAVLERLIASNPAHAALHAAATKSPIKRAHTGKRDPVDENDLRRSGRVRRLPAPVYTTFDIHDDLGDGFKAAKRPKMSADKSETPSRAKPKATTSSRPSAPPSANSLKALKARLWDVYSTYLGEPIPPPPGDGGLKAAVVRALSPVNNPKFSKMSGIQEWKNCVALYVNVGDKNGNTYDNVFTRAGSQITWFAQPRQNEESPVIQSIVATRLMAEESVEDAWRRAEEAETAPKYEDWPLHLFCRMEGCEYVYCGRLKMVDYDPRKHPMKFNMRLVDAPLLRTSEHFLGLVDLADADEKK